jgi:hypothetical protein
MAFSKMFQVSFIVLIVLLISSTTYAFAAANTGQVSTAGDGANTVSGYTITNIDYALNAVNPSALDAVSFTLDADAHTVKVKLNAAGSNWYICDNLTNHDWSCHTPGAMVAEIDQLRVTASSH